MRIYMCVHAIAACSTFMAKLSAEFYLLMGRKPEARKHFERACKQIDSLPIWFTLGFLWKARHMRNALKLGTEKQKETARQYFTDHVNKGYRVLAGIV